MSERTSEPDNSGKGATILIDGASGYVGTHLTSALLEKDYRVRCLVRNQASPEDVEVLSGLGAEIIQADIESDSEKVREAFSNLHCAVHLIGSVAPRRGETFDSLHIEQTNLFSSRCKENAVTKAIMVTALGASATSLSKYQRTKWEAELVLRHSQVPSIFLRPSLLVGRTVGRRDSKLVKRYRELIEKRKVIPLIGGGKNKIQPLFIGDMVEAVRIAIQFQVPGVGEAAPAFDLGGPAVMSMQDFVVSLMKVMGRERKFLPIPSSLARLIALGAELVQNVPVISSDQTILATTDNICQNNHLITHFNIKPSPINIALRSYGSGKEL
jgi:uncharacterized protein YbjT (DUF2867 family)